MIPFSELLIFILAALVMVLTPGPNMIYLISRSLTQGKNAGFISLLGIVVGFLFHIVLASLGLTALLLAVPYAFMILKITGAVYLLYLAFTSARSKNNIFEPNKNLKADAPVKLFSMGLFTSVLNPKVAMFYLSLFPQFVHPDAGNITLQCFQLGITQATVSFSVNFLIVVSAAKVSEWFAHNPFWVKIQRWLMASVLTGLAVKMLFVKAK